MIRAFLFSILFALLALTIGIRMKWQNSDLITTCFLAAIAFFLLGIYYLKPY